MKVQKRVLCSFLLLSNVIFAIQFKVKRQFSTFSPFMKPYWFSQPNLHSFRCSSIFSLQNVHITLLLRTVSTMVLCSNFSCYLLLGIILVLDINHYSCMLSSRHLLQHFNRCSLIILFCIKCFRSSALTPSTPAALPFVCLIVG